MDIRRKIYRLVYTQCHKLLDPNSEAFKKHQPTVTPADLLAFSDENGMDGRIVQTIRSDPVDLVNIKRDEKSPMIYLELGTGGLDFDNDEVSENMTGEIFPVLLRIVARQPALADYTFETSASMQLLAIREQLEYVLDVSVFRGLKSERVGYNLPSFVYKCAIVSTETLEGLAPGFESVDWRFAVQVHKQTQRY